MFVFKNSRVFDIHPIIKVNEELFAKVKSEMLIRLGLKAESEEKKKDKKVA